MPARPPLFGVSRPIPASALGQDPIIQAGMKAVEAIEGWQDKPWVEPGIFKSIGIGIGLGGVSALAAAGLGMAGVDLPAANALITVGMAAGLAIAAPGAAAAAAIMGADLFRDGAEHLQVRANLQRMRQRDAQEAALHTATFGADTAAAVPKAPKA